MIYKNSFQVWKKKVKKKLIRNQLKMKSYTWMHYKKNPLFFHELALLRGLKRWVLVC